MHRHLFGLWMSPRGFWFIAIVVVELLLQHYDRQQQQRACKYILLDSGRAAHNRSPLCCAQDKFLERSHSLLCVIFVVGADLEIDFYKRQRAWEMEKREIH
jgi:hypothetical protein